MDVDELDLDSLAWNFSTESQSPPQDNNEDSYSFLEKITDNPKKAFFSPTTVHEHHVLPASPEPVSPTLASALTRSFSPIARQNHSGYEPTPFPFPELLPPSSELPLLDIEMDDLASFNEEISRYELLEDDTLLRLPNASMQVPHHWHDDVTPQEPPHYTGTFSQLLSDIDNKPPFFQSTSNVPFNVLLSGHDYTYKMEHTPVVHTHPQFQPSLPPSRPPQLGPIHFPPNPSGFVRAPLPPFHMNHHLLPPSLRHNQPLHYPHMGNIVPNRHQMHRNARTAPDKQHTTRSENKEEERVFQCTYSNCGKMYAKSSHLKVSHRL